MNTEWMKIEWMKVRLESCRNNKYTRIGWGRTSSNVFFNQKWNEASGQVEFFFSCSGYRGGGQREKEGVIAERGRESKERETMTLLKIMAIRIK